MCGIAGILKLDGAPPKLDELRRMCGVMVHRGPDTEGFYVCPDVGLGMRRLSIIDLENGAQPIHNEDSTVWTVFNGEVYNLPELRRELQRAGHTFYTDSDTETVVHLYEEYGPDCVRHLRGMFGLAVWDERRKRLLLARDRIGIKPLYWGRVGGRLVFASELKALLALPSVERRINWGSVHHLFTGLATPVDESIVEGIHKLEAGHTLLATPDRGTRVERYWSFQARPDYTKSQAWFEAGLRDALEESVRVHLQSDVPVGAFLSGGVDSSSVVATMARVHTGAVKTFSIGFDEESFDESGYARQTAEALGTEHYEEILRPDVFEILGELTWHLDEPFGDVSAIPTYMVSRLAADQVKVVLSGDGGDELFAGYDRYVVEARERVLDHIPRPVKGVLGWLSRRMPEGVRGKNKLRHWSLRRGRRYLDAGTLFRREQQERLFTPEVRRMLFEGDPHGQALRMLDGDGHWLSRLQTLDVNRYLPLDILTKVDRMSMAHSIEARVPLLDHKFVEFAATIPPEMNLRGATTKHVFREAMRPLLPPGVLERPKRGFAVPLKRWFRGRLGEFVRALLLSETTRRRGVFAPDYVRRVLHWYENGRSFDLHLWTMISFELWCRVFLDAPVASSRRPGASVVFAPGAFGSGIPERPAVAGLPRGPVGPLRIPEGR